jgi:hypothetical protein
MKPWLDELTYGNPSRDQIEPLNNPSEFDNLLPRIFEKECPKNSSKATEEELKVLAEYQKGCANLPQSVIDRFVSYDKDVVGTTILFLQKRHKFEMGELINEMIKCTIPLLYKVKYKYQRPRPFQLAEYMDESVYPMFSFTSDTPSFPSGHAFQMRIITNTVGSIHPTTYQDLKKLSYEVNEQRLYYGLHYPSDIEFANHMADLLTTSKEWTTKYKI